MIVVCPRCTAHYGIDRHQFGPSARAVRCSACDHEWEAEPGEHFAADAEPAVAASHADGADENALAHFFEGEGWRGDVPSDPGGLASEGSKQQRFATEPMDGTHGDEIIPGDDLRSDVGGEQPTDAVPPEEALEFSEATDDSPVTAEAAIEADDRPPPPADADDFAGFDASAPSPPRRRGLIMAAGAAAALMLSLVVLVAAERPIIRALPGAAAVYSLFGLAAAPPGAGLDIRDVSSSREWSGTEDVLIVAGTVANVATGPRGLPPLRVTLFDADHAEIQAVIVQPVKTALAAGESVPFVARIPNPVVAARRVVVSFEVPPPEHGA